MASRPNRNHRGSESMTAQLSIDRNHTAVLIMDYQTQIVGNITSGQAELLNRAEAVSKVARRAGIPVIYVVVRFREGHPEISPRNMSFSALKEVGRLVEGSEVAEVHPGVAPQRGDVIVTKRRVGAFSTTDMETVLKARDITCLVLAGIATSGVVLSTVRWAADADYEIVVLEDCCHDFDEEVHRVLTQKIFPRQATVVKAADFLGALGES